MSAPLQFTKALAGDLGVTIADLLVAARGNDPYSFGTPTHYRDAEWFRAMVEDIGPRQGMHLRGLHYQIMSRESLKPDGSTYRNTDADWRYLTMASKAARILGLVDPLMFVDRRNAEPQIFRFDGDEEEDGYHVPLADQWRVRGIDPDLPLPSLMLPGPALTGYHYSGGDQPYRIEVWCEKSTMNHVLMPICRSYGAALVTSAGFQSMTSAVELLRRACDKPTHVIYIADMDPAGIKMPQSVARQVQFQRERCGRHGPRITIEHLLLKPETVEQFNLPPVPIKDTDRRRDNFEARHGEGAVELDALEALHPGALKDIVRQAVQRFWDDDLQLATRDAVEAVESLLDAAWSGASAGISDRLAEARDQAAAVYAKHQPRLQQIADAMVADLEPINSELESVWQEYVELVGNFEVDLPGRPEALVEGPPADPLYDSDRGHEQQLLAYRRHESLR